MQRRCVVGLVLGMSWALLLLALSSCDVPLVGEPDIPSEQEAEVEAEWTRSARRAAAAATATTEAATAIVEVQTYEAKRTAEAEATREAASGPSLEIAEMSTEVVREHEEAWVADIDVIFIVQYVSGGQSAFLVCYEENVESEETPVSGESGTSEVIVHLKEFYYLGSGEAEPFCELRDARSGEVLAEAYPGPHTVYTE
jgi:hypothetical protein